MTAFEWAGAAYPIVGMIVFVWVMGPLGMWASPSMRFAIWLMPDPRRVAYPVTPAVAVRLLPQFLAMALWVFANFILWPAAALGTLGWIVWSKLGYKSPESC